MTTTFLVVDDTAENLRLLGGILTKIAIRDVKNSEMIKWKI